MKLRVGKYFRIMSTYNPKGTKVYKLVPSGKVGEVRIIWRENGERKSLPLNISLAEKACEKGEWVEVPKLKGLIEVGE